MSTDTLPAGRELDAHVHEALGRKWSTVSRCPVCSSVFMAADRNSLGSESWCLNCEWRGGGMPFYSRDIAAAWELALLLREEWGQFDLTAGLEWHCGARTIAPWGTGDTAPLAIARAFLKAKGR